MRKNIIRMISAGLLVCLLMTVLLVPAGAVEQNLPIGKRYNIMLVIDGSGSLISHTKTDPDGMRYELVNDLLGILEDDGHNVGAIVFSGNNTLDDSDDAMQSGIMDYTGMLSFDGAAPDGSQPKDYLMHSIIKANVDLSTNGMTDIGTALLMAEQELLALQKENGLESLVFLFTDGNTCMTHESTLAKSQENLQTATYEMSTNGIRLMGLLLNKNGLMDAEEMAGIVCAANGITTSSSEFHDSFVEITNAESCHQAVDILIRFLGYGGDDPIKITKNFHDEFQIPGIGVQEMNIRLYSVDGKTLPDMDVRITQPDGHVISGNELRDISRTSRTFMVYKLVAPVSGMWKVDVTLPDENEVQCYYSPISSVQVNSAVLLDVPAEELHANMDVNFRCVLMQNDAIVDRVSAYEYYDCTVEIKNLNTGAVDTYPVPRNEEDQFVLPYYISTYDPLEVRTVFSCGNVEVESEKLALQMVNAGPEANGKTLRIPYGLFQKKTVEVNLDEYINDLEDGKNLTLTLEKTDCSTDGFHVDGKNLIINSSRIGDGFIRFSVADSQRASADLYFVIETVNMTVRYITILITIVLIVLITVFIILKKKNNYTPDGFLTAEIHLKVDGQLNKEGEVDLDIPGSHSASKTNLEKLLHNALSDSLPMTGSNKTKDEVWEELKEYSEGLRTVLVRNCITLSGNKKVGAIEVRNGKNWYKLYDNSMDIQLDDCLVILSFEPNAEEFPDIDDEFEDIDRKSRQDKEIDIDAEFE